MQKRKKRRHNESVNLKASTNGAPPDSNTASALPSDNEREKKKRKKVSLIADHREVELICVAAVTFWLHCMHLVFKVYLVYIKAEMRLSRSLCPGIPGSILGAARAGERQSKQ